MVKTFIYLIFALFSLTIADAKDFFVRLSSSGMNFKSSLVDSKFENIPGLSSQSLKKIGKNMHFEPVFDSYRSNSNLDQWLIMNGDSLAAQQLKSSNIIEYFEDIGRFIVEPISINGKAYSQYYLNNIEVNDAWDVTMGSSKIIVGVIDTGIDYKHPDLQNALWINQGEDLNGNGILDSSDINGIDDDGNGYIDDVIGWDFTDASDFPDGGDYQNPDNDPMDEFRNGHGTQIAGIIAASDLSGSGFSGIAPKVKVMNLRAGTASGYLEEDDVAKALIYALDNGASIINMSFGDVALSRFLRDVIHYVHQEGLVLVASSGNSGSDEVHFPSGLQEVISVGASTQQNYMAGFSNYGNTLDLTAPGVDILSTAIGGGYNVVNGTSFSAPIVSAVCGLILSNNPSYGNEQVRNILKTSATDILDDGWDIYSAAGVVSAGKAVHVKEAGTLKLLQPCANAYTAEDTIFLIGSAVHPDLRTITVSYGIGDNPDAWIMLNDWEQRQVFEDTLGRILLSKLSDTTLTIRLQMSLINGREEELRSLLHIDRTPPVIKNNKIDYLFDKKQEALLISFDTDDVCKARLFLRKSGRDDPWERIDFAYETNRQRIKLDRSQFDGEYEFFTEAENLSGLVSADSNNGSFYHFNLAADFKWQDYFEIDRSIPAGYLLPKSVDLDKDGKKEIIISRYNEINGFGPIEIYEFDNGDFNLVNRTSFTAIPRDAGDVDDDGLSDILLGYGKYTFLLEASSENGFPEKIVWQDTLDFWGAGYADSDGDGKQEIIGRNDSLYIVLENIGDNQFKETARLPNGSSGNNLLSVPQFKVLDYDNNGRQEIVYSDEDGDLLIFEAEGDNQYTALPNLEEKNPQEDNLLQILQNDSGGDFLFKASHTSESLNYEHEFDGRFWQIIKYGNKTGQIGALDTINVFGFQNLKEYNSGIQCTSFNGQNYLFAALYPDLYLFEITDQGAEAVWYKEGACSNTVVADDFDGDGMPEFYFNEGSKIAAFAKSAVSRPSAPFFLKVNPLDSVRVHLSWGRTSMAERYNIYRGKIRDSMTVVKTADGDQFVDEGLTAGEKYFYAVTAVDSAQTIPESRKSELDSVFLSYPPKLIGAEAVNERQIVLSYNENVTVDKNGFTKIILRSSGAHAVSAMPLKEQNKILCAFDRSFPDGGNDTVLVDGILNTDGVPIDMRFNKCAVFFPQRIKEPYVTNVAVADRYHITIRFSRPMKRGTLCEIGNYTLEPAGKVLSVEVEDSSDTEILLTLDCRSMAGSLGKPAYILMNNLVSTDGMELTAGNKVNLYRQEDGLDDILVYPQPVRPYQNELIFAKLPKYVEIDIFNLSGKKIWSLKNDTEYGGIRWNLRDNNGYQVKSGIYIYEIRSGEKRKLGKIAIMR
jgi:subtilisin family serine protease